MQKEMRVNKTFSIESRYERKYIIPVSSEFLKSWLLTHPSLIKKQHPTQQVHSLYLDTPSLTTAADVLDGVSDRFKVRLRWYHQKDTINTLRFELKRRYGDVIQKQVKTLPLNSPVSLESVIADPLKYFRLSSTQTNCSLYRYLYSWQPSVIVSYERSYYIDSSEMVRITVDEDITTTRLYAQSSFSASQRDLGIIILELKYPISADEFADRIKQLIPVGVTRHSKYLFGVLAGI